MKFSVKRDFIGETDNYTKHRYLCVCIRWIEKLLTVALSSVASMLGQSLSAWSFTNSAKSLISSSCNLGPKVHWPRGVQFSPNPCMSKRINRKTSQTKRKSQHNNNNKAYRHSSLAGIGYSVYFLFCINSISAYKWICTQSLHSKGYLLPSMVGWLVTWRKILPLKIFQEECCTLYITWWKS